MSTGSASTERVRVAVIGLGYWGPNVARNISMHPQVELAALCDLAEERLASQARLYPAASVRSSVTDILEDPSIDAVAIATPVATHFELARDALLADKHVLVEKPFTSTAWQGEELVTLAEQKRRVLMVDHVFLYSPAVQKVAELHRQGTFGDLQFIDSVRINLGMVQQDVNVIWDLAPHDLSIFDHIVGHGPSSVLAVASALTGLGFPTLAHLHLDYGDGLIASVHVNWRSPVKIRHLLVGGTRRSALYNDLDHSEPLKLYDRGVELAEDPESRRRMFVSYRSGDVLSPKLDKVEPLHNVIGHFASCVLTGATPLSDGASGVRMLRVLEAVDLSLQKGGVPVQVPDG